MSVERSVLITGASRGLGEAIAKEFWGAGASLLLAARSLNRLEALRDTLLPSAAPGQQIHCLPTDLAYPGAPAALLAEAHKRTGRLDVLINNAAIVGPIGRFWENEPDLWTQTLQTNLLAPAELMRSAIPWMAESGGGVIINISGGGATGPRPFFSAYATAKAGLVRLSETLAAEAQPLGVRIHCIAPGAMNTEMLEAVLRTSADAAGGEFEKARQQKEKGGTDPAVAARLCVYLTGDAVRSVTGRLFSAVWDPWASMEEWAEQLEKSDIYTLRRIVPEDRGKEWS